MINKNIIDNNGLVILDNETSLQVISDTDGNLVVYRKGLDIITDTDGNIILNEPAKTYDNDGLCKDLLAIPLQDGTLDLSWELDTDRIRKILKEEKNIEKVINFYDNVDFLIEIDNKDTFDTINKKQYIFSELSQTYKGKIVFSAIIDFNKNQFEETTYYYRVKFTPSKQFNIILNKVQGIEDIEFDDDWSEPLLFTIPKNYTKDIIEQMYSIVADYNAYNKEVKSANIYYLFQAFADTLNKQVTFTNDIENSNYLFKSKPDYLAAIFGELLKFTNIDNLSMEEYRRILRNLTIGYQNGGAWNYIANTIKYFIGHTPELVNFKNFYPWILRKQNLTDPNPFSNRNYNNPESNYYIFKQDFITYKKNKNEVMLLKDFDKKFTFIVKIENYFNTGIDKTKISNILDILKSAYTKYILNIEDIYKQIDIGDLILVDDDNALLANDETPIQY